MIDLPSLPRPARAVSIALTPQDAPMVEVHVLDQRESGIVDLMSIARGGPSWLEYVRGPAWVLRESSRALTGWTGSLADDGAWEVTYHAESDRATPVHLTRHSHFGPAHASHSQRASPPLHDRHAPSSRVHRPRDPPTDVDRRRADRAAEGSSEGTRKEEAAGRRLTRPAEIMQNWA